MLFLRRDLRRCRACQLLRLVVIVADLPVATHSSSRLRRLLLRLRLFLHLLRLLAVGLLLRAAAVVGHLCQCDAQVGHQRQQLFVVLDFALELAGLLGRAVLVIPARDCNQKAASRVS